MPLAVVDCRIPQPAKEALVRRGYTVVLLPPHPRLPAPIASHADLLLFFTPNALWTTPLYAELAKAELDCICRETERALRTTAVELDNAYPQDILLDAAPIGERLLCLPAHTAIELTEQYAGRVIAVRQGYAKCSVLPVNSHALITSDPSIASAAKSEGLKALLIESGHITLEGYNTGFLGGASSFSPDGGIREIFFCGSLSAHPSGKKIADLCRACGREPISLGAFPLTDVGTIFLL